MKAMVLAAGKGRRLRPLTAYRAKPALPILGRALIEYTLEILARAGIREVVVNLHHNPESILRVLSGPAGRGFRFHYSEEPVILGTAGGLKRAEGMLGGETFLLINGDTLVDLDIACLVEWHRTRGGEATLLMRPKPTGSDYTPFALDSRGRVTVMGAETTSPLMFAGVWVLEPSVLGRLPTDQFAALEKELLPALIEEGAAFGYATDAPWFDIGTPRRYLSACLNMARHGIFPNLWKAERFIPPYGASSEALVVAGPGTSCHPGARFYGDSVLGSGCRLEKGAVVQGSVLWDGVSVGPRAAVRNSLIGEEVSLAAGSETDTKVVLRRGKPFGRVRAREVVGPHVIASIKR